MAVPPTLLLQIQPTLPYQPLRKHQSLHPPQLLYQPKLPFLHLQMHPFSHPPMHPLEAVDPFAAPTTTRIAMWKAGVAKTNLVVKDAMESGSKKVTAPPMVSQNLASVPTMSMDAALLPLAKEANTTSSACRQRSYMMTDYRSSFSNK
mmetsp:Transcript_13453/g.32428  ORF Transcript_13453/g.32428 Transcript_13453/m.32428 type:complete len:148 (+) Transcript_13453:726-1169(+)